MPPKLLLALAATLSLPLLGSIIVTGVPVTATEGTANNVTVATFTDTNLDDGAASFSANIDWGDGAPLSLATIIGGAGSFSVTGNHTYAEEGAFTITASVSGAASGSSFSTATTNEGDVLVGTGMNIPFQPDDLFSGTVATYTDTYTLNTPSDFLGVIDWGDGTESAATIIGGSGSFSLFGSHIYTVPGRFTITTSLSDDAPGTATASTTATAANTPEPSMLSVVAIGTIALAALRRIHRRQRTAPRR